MWSSGAPRDPSNAMLTILGMGSVFRDVMAFRINWQSSSVEIWNSEGKNRCCGNCSEILEKFTQWSTEDEKHRALKFSLSTFIFNNWRKSWYNFFLSLKMWSFWRTNSSSFFPMYFEGIKTVFHQLVLISNNDGPRLFAKYFFPAKLFSCILANWKREF